MTDLTETDLDESTRSSSDSESQDVHHHARTGDDRVQSASGMIVTLCGLHLPRPRPGAAKLTCCGMCALAIGGPCR